MCVLEQKNSAYMFSSPVARKRRFIRSLKV